MGYVGLPLAAAFAKKNNVIGFDINNRRIEALKKGFDETFEVTSKDLCSLKKLTFTSNVPLTNTAGLFYTELADAVDGNGNKIGLNVE